MNDDDLRGLDRVLGKLLDTAIVDIDAAKTTCRLCDAHACGHYDGTCPVTRAADRHRHRQAA
jgi:hypothetical protein